MTPDDKDMKAHGEGMRGAEDAEERGPVSAKLRRVMETRAGFWLRWGISVVSVALLILFLLAWSIPLDRFGGRSFIDYLLH